MHRLAPVLLPLLLAAPFAARPQTSAASPQTALPRTQVTVRLLGRIGKMEREQLQKDWLPAIQQQLMANWRPLQPETAQPPMQSSGATIITADVTPKGRVDQSSVTETSDNLALDQAAQGALKSAQPFPPLPPGIRSRSIRVLCEFLYNGSTAPSSPSR